MFDYSDNYYLRKKYLGRGEIPTQSVIRSIMTDPLAEIYFKSMDSKTRVLAGLDPPLKGGGRNWYQPPEELLAGRSVLKPTKKKYLVKLGYNIFEHLSQAFEALHKKTVDNWLRTAKDKNDDEWKKLIQHECKELELEVGLQEHTANKDNYNRAFSELSCLFATVLNDIEENIFNAATKDVENCRNILYENSVERYKTMVKHQAEELYKKYESKLKLQKDLHRRQFVFHYALDRLKVCKKLHDLKIEKHVAIEKLRHLLECRNMACQVYIALIEREERDSHLRRSQEKHSKIIKVLDNEAANQDVLIKLEEEKQKAIKDRHNIWKRKVCLTVKNFQSFVEYCLQQLPQHAAFFMNLENVVLMQMAEASENPSASSVFCEGRTPPLSPPPPRPRPYHLFCDAPLSPPDPTLCPKHCTSSSSLLPAIVVNNQYFYSACDNLSTFTDKASKYISNQLDNNDNMDDTHDNAIPIKPSPSEQLRELQFESSMMRVLQKDYPNTKNVPVECTCATCNLPYCFESPKKEKKGGISQSKQATPPIEKHFKLSQEMQSKQNHFPNISSYLDYSRTKKCDCKKTYWNKREFEKYYPPYMRKTSKFIDDEVILGKYKLCSSENLKKIMEKERESPIASTSAVPKTKDASTQYEDVFYNSLCKCLSNREREKLEESSPETALDKFRLETPHDSSLDLSLKSFANKRALTILNLLTESPELMEIFKSKNCDFDN